MWNEPKSLELNAIPKLYESSKLKLENKIIHMHFFIGSSDWYVAEYGISEANGRETFFGYVIINGDYQNAEWGYFDFEELKELKTPVIIREGHTCRTGRMMVEVDRDIHWKPVKAIEVQKIAQGMRWK